MRDRYRVVNLGIVVLLVIGARPGVADDRSGDSGQATSAAPPVTGFLTNWTRMERTSYFEPQPGGGNHDYGHISNRRRFGLRRSTERYDLMAAGQYVQFGGLPNDAVGPGALGVGALYFGHSRDTSSNQIYLKYLNVRLTDLLPGLTVQLGRFGYASGGEVTSSPAKVETVKRLRVHSRLIGGFEWSLYQRSYDGFRVDVRQPAWVATFSGFRPTQGGFEEEANGHVEALDVLAGTLTLLPDEVVPHTDWQVFAYRYDDRRRVTGRPDNTGRPVAAADVQINSFGTTLVGAYPSGAGELDLLVWLVGQSGSWYELDHGALAIVSEVGYQWREAQWRPWIRGGFLRASGDDDPSDATHGTFFQMLPTVRKYSLSATYAQMNLWDAFGQLILRPTDKLNVRADVHRLGLIEAADRWYQGSGVTQEEGTIFGYAARPSNGATDLGTVVEGAATYTVNPTWSVNGYVGSMTGGDVVTGAFAGDRLTYAYLENIVSF